MGTKYSTQTVSGYNSSPPSDDGAVSAANKVTWATIKTKLPDPILTLAQGINTQLVTALDNAPTLQTTAYTTVAGDNGKPILVTGTTTISLGAATTMTAGYATTVANIGSNVVTVNLASATDTLDGTVNGTITVPVNGSMTFAVNSGANGYITIACGHAINISTITASGLGTFNAGISIPTGQSVTGAGTATVTGFQSGSFGTAGNQGSVKILGSTSGTATFSTDATVTQVTLDKPLAVTGNMGTPNTRHLTLSAGTWTDVPGTDSTGLVLIRDTGATGLALFLAEPYASQATTISNPIGGLTVQIAGTKLQAKSVAGATVQYLVLSCVL